MGAHPVAVLNAAIKASTAAWMETHGKIWPRDRTKGLATPKLNYLQRKIQSVVDRFEETQAPCRIIGLKPRARGSTTFFTALGYTMMRRHSTSAVFIGGQSDQTVGLWNMLKTYHANDRFDWGNSGEVNEKGARFSNGSRAKKETAKDVTAGIGDTYGCCHATEVARWSQFGVSNAAAVMANILKAIPLLPATSIFLESTAETAGGDYYNRWLNAVDSDEFVIGNSDISFGGYARCFAGWYQFAESALRLTEEEKLRIQKSLDADEEFYGENELLELYGKRDEDGVMRLGESVDDYDAWEQLAWRRYSIREECDRDVRIFDRDYPHCWEVAFMKSGKMRFNQTGVATIRKRLRTAPKPIHAMLEDTRDRGVALHKTDANESQFTIFEKPIPGRKYIVAVDPATGASQAVGLDPDSHAVFCLRAGYYDAKGVWIRPATVARVIPCKWETDMIAAATWKLARFYGGRGGAIIAVEINMDRGIVEHLKAFGANLWQRRQLNKREDKITSAIGFQTNAKTRETLISTLATAIREWDTPGAGIDVWCPHAITQLENFIDKDGRSEAGQGNHDDDVLAIAIGLELIDHATTMPPTLMMGGFGVSPEFGIPPPQSRGVNQYS